MREEQQLVQPTSYDYDEKSNIIGNDAALGSQSKPKDTAQNSYSRNYAILDLGSRVVYYDRTKLNKNVLKEVLKNKVPKFRH